MSLFGRIRRFLYGAGVDLSYSKLRVYQTCPWKYKLMYVDGWRVPPNARASLGQSVHRALEQFFGPGPRTLEGLLDAFDAHWVNEGFATPQEALLCHEEGRQMLENFFEAEKSSPASVLFVEKSFSFSLGPHTVQGIMDRVDRGPDGRVIVVDYKTHADPWPAERVRQDLQLTLYALGCERGLGLKVGGLAFYFLNQGLRVETSRTEEDKRQALALLKETGGRIARADFTPDTRSCPLCEFRTKCIKAKA